jgi:hypothetical protein
MEYRNGRSNPRSRRRLSNRSVWGVAAASCLVCLALATPCDAASIPAWLDDAITEFNEKNDATQIEFLEIKDDFVWYTIPYTTDIGSKDIRERIYEMVAEHGYNVTDEEERVTTGKPPSPVSPYKTKKCWTRSFVLNIEQLSNTTSAGGRGGRGRSGQRQRMLTSQVCDDKPYWLTGFRILQ